ncbi:MAG: efflux RND transporter periplasmic adaptor subunit [Burkholderiales bacterium]|nr:efflux RND transporter periplasmic adaptor subunit [Burkholderiales bacterium]
MRRSALSCPSLIPAAHSAAHPAAHSAAPSVRLSAVLSIARSATLSAALLSATWALAAPGAHGPGGEHLDAPGVAVNASGLARLPDGSVNVPKAAQRRMAIRTVLAPQSEAAATVELPGKVVMDPNASGRVQAAHGGRIEPGPRGLPVAGQPVKRGDVLAYVRHHAEPYALGAQQAQLAELKAQRQLAEARALRLEGLEGTVPRKEIEAARSEVQSLAERERSIGASLGAREALVAPVSGVIARAELVAGQVVDPRDVLFEVIDPTRMLVEATTADTKLAGRIGGAALQGAAEAKLRLLGVSRSLRDGVLPLMFAVVPAKAGTALPLAIGQPVTVVVQARERIKGIVLPAQAVVRNPANEPIVWIKSGTERFIPQPVQVRALDASTVVVTQGLGTDNRVVVQGASLIAQIR